MSTCPGWPYLWASFLLLQTDGLSDWYLIGEKEGKKIHRSLSIFPPVSRIPSIPSSSCLTSSPAGPRRKWELDNLLIRLKCPLFLPLFSTSQQKDATVYLFFIISFSSNTLFFFSFSSSPWESFCLFPAGLGHWVTGSSTGCFKQKTTTGWGDGHNVPLLLLFSSYKTKQHLYIFKTYILYTATEKKFPFI